MNQPVAIITGAGRGIGQACAVELSRLGYQLALVSRNAHELAETQQLASPSLPIPADVTQPRDVQRIISATLDHFGRIDALVNCAGIAPVISVDQMSIEQWHEVIDTNLSSVFYLSRDVWPTFRQQQGGVIVNISSLACRDPFPGFAAYGAAKAGLNLLGLSLAREGQPLGIRVHTIAPGAVETAMLRKFLSPEKFPSSKTIAPADVARVIAQCIQGDLRYTSGEVIFLHK